MSTSAVTDRNSKTQKHYSDEELTRFKTEISAGPIIATRVNLRRENTEWVGLCPFHDEKTPSFKVYKHDDGTWLYHCFGCGANGNLFQFVERFDKVSFTRAVELVLEQASAVDNYAETLAEPKKNVTFTIAQHAQCERALEESPEGQKWITDRGITMETARRFHLGFVRDATAVCGTSHPWRAKGWVTFPTFSDDGKTVLAIKYRSLVAKDEMIGDRNVSGILRAQHTATTLYNCCELNGWSGDVFICEGEPDTLVLSQTGTPAVGLPSAQYKWTESDTSLVTKGARIFLAGDNDKSGAKAVNYLWKELGPVTYKIQWPDGIKDANEMLLKKYARDRERFQRELLVLKADAVQRGEWKEPKTESKDGLVFHSPAVPPTNSFDYVLAPLPDSHAREGWFPRGEVSLVGAASGGGKTTLLYQMLMKQASKAMVFGRETYGKSFQVFALDRGAASHERTMYSMRLPLNAIPFKHLHYATDLPAVQAIINELEQCNPLPDILAVEGVDYMTSRVIDSKCVSEFMSALHAVAAHFNIAIIGTLGSPKIKIGQGYVSIRDNFLGSSAWARFSETMLNLQFPQHDDTQARRKLYVMMRHENAEKFTLEFQFGLLVEVPDDEVNNQPATDTLLAKITWFKEQAQRAKEDPSKRWWTVLDFRQAMAMKHTAAQEILDDCLAKNLIRIKPGKKRGKGGAKMFCWNESKTNTIWLKEQEQEHADLQQAF
ncbi:MAG: CHC2 zinc finger domain-containing protein [Candidatus Acidiferrales bacterium]